MQVTARMRNKRLYSEPRNNRDFDKIPLDINTNAQGNYLHTYYDAFSVLSYKVIARSPKQICRKQKFHSFTQAFFVQH